MEIQETFLLFRALDGTDENGAKKEKVLNEYQMVINIRNFVMRFINEWLVNGTFDQSDHDEEFVAVSFWGTTIEDTYTFQKDDLCRLLMDWLVCVVDLANGEAGCPSEEQYTSATIKIRITHNEDNGVIRVESAYSKKALDADKWTPDNTLEVVCSHHPIKNVVCSDQKEWNNVRSEFESTYPGLKCIPGLYLDLDHTLNDPTLELDPKVERDLRLRDVTTIGDLMDTNPKDLESVSPSLVQLRASLRKLWHDYFLAPSSIIWRVNWSNVS